MNNACAGCGPCGGRCTESPRAEFRIERSSVRVEGHAAQRPRVRWIVALAMVVVIGGYASQSSIVQGLISQQEHTLRAVWQDAKSILAP